MANAARSVGAASTQTGNQFVNESRSNGVFGQLQTSWKDKLFMQVAGRLDRNSAFGVESQVLLQPEGWARPTCCRRRASGRTPPWAT